MRREKRWISAGLAALAILSVAAASCGRGEQPATVSLDRLEPLDVPVTPRGASIRFAIGSMLTPKEGNIYYRHLLAFVETELGRPISLVDRENYGEINDLLKSGDLDAAFVCSGPYVQAHDDFGLELLAVPVAYGKPFYHAYIIVHTESPATELEDLRGHSFAFTDPQSNTGTLVPMSLLAALGETPDTFFSRYEFTYAHDRSITAVAQKIVDGAAVDSLIWDYAARTNPRFTSRTKVIWTSPPYGIPPVVTRPGFDPETRERLLAIFLSMHRSDRGREILDKMMIDRFTEGSDADYDSIREMLEATAGISFTDTKKAD